MKKQLSSILILSSFLLHSQTDSTKKDKWYNMHFQQTTVVQGHPDFNAKYTGANSLAPHEKPEMTVTADLYLGAKLWKGAEIYFNPEIAGGSGLSQGKGIADYTNGEAFRVGDPAPSLYIARAFYKQVFALSKETEKVDDDLNQVPTHLPKKHLYVIIGKFGLADYFDANTYSHDPRSQFLNWGLMDNGAWDYAANTRGYTRGIAIGYESPKFAVRAAAVQEPTIANGSVFDNDIAHEHSLLIELEKRFTIKKRAGSIRLLGFMNNANMGNYNQAINHYNQYHDTVNIVAVQKVGTTKFGLCLNIEQALTESIGIFARASWNDGQNETWAYTEIDQSASLGFSFNGKIWKRPDDNFGIAEVVSGISKQHAEYLRLGGYGFIIGDGNLNYAPEAVTEVYYNFKFFKYNLWLTPDYQLVVNPAYNKDRGPILNVFSARVHVEF